MRRLWVAVGLVAVGCAPDEPPSVLIITLDTTRADHLGPYGFPSADTPTWDTFAEDGMLFERAYSTVPLTIPSHSTIMTGRVPPSHGVRDNGDFVLGDDAVTLAERFHDAGYDTAAFTAAFPTQRRWGFGQGFDAYSDHLNDLPTRLDWSDQRRAGEVVDDAVEWLEGANGPAFVWVHLFDAHWPYDPPEPYASEFAKAPYDGEIAYAAHEAGRLLAVWDERHPRSIVVVTADHGEGMGDGGERTHGFLLHDGTIHVPLMVRGEGFEAGRRVDDAVSHIDIAPTVLAAAGLGLDDLLQGEDLRTGGSDRAYSEALTGQFNLGLAPLYAYTDDDGRYMEGGYGAWYDRAGTAIRTLPDATADLVPHRERLAAMRAGFDEVLADEAALDAEALDQLAALGYLGGDPTAPAGEIDPRDVIDVIPLTWGVRQAIGRRQFDVATTQLGKLAARMPGTFGVDQLSADLVMAQGRAEEAYELYTALYLRAPNSTNALRLGGLAVRLGYADEGEQWFTEALEHDPASPEAMVGRVRAMLQQDGRELEAELLADEYLAIYPDHAELALLRAIMHLRAEEPERALEDAEAALAEMPRNPDAMAISAEALWQVGRADDAIERLTEARRLDRFHRGYRMTLTRWLLEVGRTAEAVRTIRPAVSFDPADAETRALYEEASAQLAAARTP